MEILENTLERSVLQLACVKRSKGSAMKSFPPF